MSRWARPGPPAGADRRQRAASSACWWLVAHNAGSGWVQVLGDLVFGALLIGIVGPVRGRDAGPGQPCAARRVTASPASRSPVSRRSRAAASGSAPSSRRAPRSFVGPRGRRGAADEVVTLVPARRGVHDSVEPRHRLGGAVRAAVVDEAGAAPAARRRSTCRPVAAGPSPCPCDRTRGPATCSTGPASDEGAAPRRPPLRARRRPAARPLALDGACRAADGAGARAAGGRTRDDHGGAARVIPRRPNGWRRAPWAPSWPCSSGRPGPARHDRGVGACRRSRGRPAQRGPPPGPRRRRRGRWRRAVSIVDGGPAGQPAGGARGLDPAAARLPGRRAGGDRRLRLAAGDRLDDGASAPWRSSRPARPSRTPPGPGLPAWVKVLVAVGAIAACVWFFHAVSSPADGITSVIDPLTVLLVTVLVVHSFHVPTRRDLLFTLGASAGLMAVGGALAIDLRFGLYVVAWACCGLWGLTEMWTSASGGGRLLGDGPRAGAGGDVDRRRRRLPRPAGAGRLVPCLVHVAGRRRRLGRVSPGASPATPAWPRSSPAPARPTGRIRVGGYLGFAASLNTALRGDLGNTLVMQVRAQRPSYWVGETFDTWQGQSWTESQPVPRRPLRESSPVRPARFRSGDVPFGQSDLQTFYVASPTANLVFHAESAEELWFPAGKVYVAGDGTIVSPLGLGSRVHLHRRFAGEHRHAGATAGGRQPVRAPSGHGAAGSAAAPRLPPRARAGPGGHRPRHRRPTTRCSRSSTGSAPTRTTRRTSRRCPPAPTPWTSSSSATGSASASRSRPRWP